MKMCLSQGYKIPVMQYFILHNSLIYQLCNLIIKCL